MTKAAVTAIRWVPGSEGRILASYTDGCMLLLDTEREDAPLSLEVNTTDMCGGRLRRCWLAAAGPERACVACG